MFNSKLINRGEVAEGTETFWFEKPADFIYKPGQHMDIKLVNPPETDSEGDKRTFSFVSSPDEPQLQIATRMRDTVFKRVLKSSPLNTPVELDGPFGSLLLHNDASKPAVFLAGGIGITPFMSILRNAARQKLPHKLFLFYSNRRPEDAAFLDELQKLQAEDPNYKFVGTMTEMEKSVKSWDGERGYVTAEMIKKYVGELSTPIYYIAGPQVMVAAMRKILNDAGLNDDNIRTEEFAGY
jgi:ferredoxin-NADP reductase